MNIYKIINIEDYTANQDYFESDDFQNRGSIRFNLANTEVLLEQDESKFPEGIGGTDYTQEEIKQYLQDNSSYWVEELEV